MTNLTAGLFGAGTLLVAFGAGLIYLPAGIITLGALALAASITEAYG